MDTDTIYWGEAYDISASGQDAQGAATPVVSGHVRITKDKIGGKQVFSSEMTIAAGVATITIDTRGDAWGPGVYYYDCRLTDTDGYDQWTDPVQLVLENRNALPSA